MLLPAEGLFLEPEVTYPRLITLTETFLMLNLTLSPGTASVSVVMSPVSSGILFQFSLRWTCKSWILSDFVCGREHFVSFVPIRSSHAFDSVIFVALTFDEFFRHRRDHHMKTKLIKYLLTFAMPV